MIYDLMDIAIATDLGVSVEEYIEKIESVDEDVMESILMPYFQGNIKLAKELFDGI